MYVMYLEPRLQITPTLLVVVRYDGIMSGARGLVTEVRLK